MAVAKKAVPKELLDSLLADYRKPEDLIGENGLLKQLTKLLVEKALEAEIADHLGVSISTVEKDWRMARAWGTIFFRLCLFFAETNSRGTCGQKTRASLYSV